MPNPSAAEGRPTRIAYLSYSTAQFDSRSQRMARSAVAAGDRVTILARWEPGLPLEELADGYRIVRVPFDVRMAVPGFRARGRRRVAARLALDAAARRDGAADGPSGSDGGASGATAIPAAPPSRWGDSLRGTRFSPFLRSVRGAILSPRRLITFPLRPMAWAVALEDVAEPADIWHGMWAGSLPALGRLRRRHGGRTVYDSRDVYLHARAFDRMGPLWRRFYLGLERRWASSADAVVTVNDAYADILERTLRIPRPPVVMNCPERWTPPDPPPDLIRERLGLDAGTSIVLYQGNLMTERGIEESMAAIVEVPGAVLVLLGYGGSRDAFAAMALEPRYRGRVHLLPAVPPTELLAWTASADALVMAIQPTTLNHRYTTPQKLWEAMAAGVPVVASDLPGMASVVTSTGCGVLCDPTSPASIACGDPLDRGRTRRGTGRHACAGPRGRPDHLQLGGATGRPARRLRSAAGVMTVAHVVGARPNFMKAAPVIRALEARGVEQRVIHTGQHYDAALSDVFFRELGLPEPDVNLGVGSGTQAGQTAALMVALERAFLEAPPALAIVYGDVNSTLAAALVAAKIDVPLAHVEAGLRSFDDTMPEEINRRVTDLLCPTCCS